MMEERLTIAQALGVPETPRQLVQSSSCVGSPSAATKVQEDFDLARDTLREILSTGRNALDRMTEILDESESPRAAEVLATTVSTLADTANKLLELHQRQKEIEKAEVKNQSTTNNTTNNNLFVGSTTELQRMLKDMGVGPNATLRKPVEVLATPVGG